ncbi:MAG: TonB-dependent receptor, partial [Bacteroidota bacterium]|nr:TonB-dependent receptor [Bacteroidota bacterium]
QPLNKLSKAAAVISHKQIEDNMQSNMTDVLASTPGFTQVWEYHSPILLRGMNSKRLLIMKNGNRRIGTFPGGYFGQDMNIYDTKKIEIIKGPGSVIYGSGAISGIINIINHEPFGRNETTAKILSGYGSNNNEILEVVKLCHKKKNFGISINGKYRKTEDYFYGNGERAENSDVEDRDISINTGFKISEKHKFIVDANYHFGDWGKPRGFNGEAKRFTEIRNQEERVHTAFNYTYSPNSFIESVKFNMYYDKGTRDYFKYKYSTITGNLSSLDLVHYNDNYGGGKLFTIFNLFENNKVTTGVDGYFFLLDNPAEIFDYYDDSHGQLQGHINAGQQNLGAFINDEWTISEKMCVITGIRFDVATVNEGEKSDLDEREETRTATSGNVGLVFSPYEKMHFSLNVGKAFRMPSAEELFTEIISCKGTKIGNPDLKPEYGWNIDLGFRGKAIHNNLKYDVALFYNKMNDFINETPDIEHDDIDFTYKNTDAKIIGSEISMSYRFKNVFKPSNKLFVALGGAYVYGIDLFYDNDTPLFGIPPLKINGELKYYGMLNRKWLTGYNIKITSEYAEEQNRIAQIPEGTDGGPWGYLSSKRHANLNFSLAVNSNSLPYSPKLRLVIKNVFNSDYHPFGSYIPVMGRNFKVVMLFKI